MITVEITIQKVERKVGYGQIGSTPETILSVAFTRDSLPVALAYLKGQLEMLEKEST